MANVKLTGVKKIYDNKVVAVHDFDLEIQDKEFVVFVGPSGCGKSTTLRMIAGLEEISEGTLEIDGEVVNDLQPKDRDIAMVFQNYALYPHMTVYDNIAFSLRLKKMPEDEVYQKVTNAAEILGITEYLTRKPRALSGGQRQRVAIGRAIVRNPKVFDQTEAMTLGDRIVIMKDGFIMQVGSPEQVFDTPRNLFVATFIGSPQMNLFNASLVRSGADSYAVRYQNITVPLDSDRCALLKNNGIGSMEKVILGVRPEHMTCCFDNENNAVHSTITVNEMMGSELHLHVAAGNDQNIIVRIPTIELDHKRRSSLVHGNALDFTFSSKVIQLFDPETEQSLLWR